MLGLPAAADVGATPCGTAVEVTRRRVRHHRAVKASSAEGMQPLALDRARPPPTPCPLAK
jgi:hypothetical protein